MSDLRRLDEIVYKVDDKITFKKDLSKPYVGLEHIATKSSYLSGFSEANTSISTNAAFSAGDVLFGKLRPNLRKCVVAPFDGYCSTDILVLRAKSDVCNRFAGRVFQTEKVGSAAEMTSIGTKMPRTSWTHLKEVEVYYPDRHSQEVIANILDTLDTTIRQTEAIIAKLQQVKQGLLHDLLTRGIDANGQLRPPVEQAPHLYKESPLGWIPRGWDIQNGWKVCDEIIVGIVIRPAQFYRESGIPVLRSANVREDGLSLTDLVYMSRADHVAQRKSLVTPSDVLTVRTGYPGTSCVVDEQVKEANCVDVIISRPSKALMPQYWAEWINSSYGKNQVLKVQGGLAQQHFNVSELGDLLVHLPNIEEQLRIVDRIQVIKTRLHKEVQTKSALVSIKSALMDDLLTGRVRVTTLLSGETPASKELKGKSE